MSKSSIIGKVIDADNFNIWGGKKVSQSNTAYSTEAVDCNFNHFRYNSLDT
jgi:hypothetical protein